MMHATQGPDDRRKAPRRLADVLQMLDSARHSRSAELSAAVAAVLAARGIDVAPEDDLAALRSAVARQLASSARHPDRRVADRRIT